MSQDNDVFYLPGIGPFVPRAVLGLTRLYGIAADGAVSTNSIPFDLDALMTTEMFTRVPEMPTMTFETGRADLVFTPGAGCVLGKPSSGKTLLADTLAARNPGRAVTVRFREPEVDSLLYERSFVRELWSHLNSSAELIFIDSLRTTFYIAGGATGKGGVNMGIFPLLTAFDILGKHHGKVLLFALNPMTTDDDAINFYLEAAKGSVSHTLYATQPKNLQISSRAATTRADFGQKYEPVAKTAPATPPRADSAPVAFRQPIDSIVDLYTTTTR